MTFRRRLLASFLLAVLLPIGLFAWGVRRQLDVRLAGEEAERLAMLVTVIRRDLSGRSGELAGTVRSVANQLASDPRFRLAAAGEESERRWLLDQAGVAMRARGLDLLMLTDDQGRILSSGHFRNEYGRRVPGLVEDLASIADSTPLLRARTADGTLLTLARTDTFSVGGRRYAVIGGVATDSAFVAGRSPAPGLRVALVPPGVASPGPAGGTAGEIRVPFVDAARPGIVGSARFVITRQPGALTQLRRDVMRWLLAAAGVTLLLGLLVAAWLASRMSRPLRELAARTESIDLDALDQDFTTDRTDEIGTLSRLLGAMTARLRGSAVRLRDAERRAAVGDMSRQVTHDIKNGLAPIRHVLRHLTEVAEREPERLAGIFAERRGTLESSVGYLETLARNYSKLSPEPVRSPADVNAIVREVLGSVPAGQADVRMQLAEALSPLATDPLSVRRIVENLVGNAIDSLGGGPGVVTVTTATGGTGGTLITVADTGAGMSKEQLEHAFDDFYTSKPGGTGLGLSVVRRLVADIGGSLRVATEPGTGTRFTVELGGAA